LEKMGHPHFQEPPISSHIQIHQIPAVCGVPLYRWCQVQDLLPYGFAVHHAGLPRADRKLVEERCPEVSIGSWIDHVMIVMVMIMDDYDYDFG
jgi:hypothetical protein